MHLHVPQEYQPGDLLLAVDLSRQPITSRKVFSSLYIFSSYVIINACRKEYKKKTIHKCSYDNTLHTHARTHARTHAPLPIPPPHQFYASLGKLKPIQYLWLPKSFVDVAKHHKHHIFWVECLCVSLLFLPPLLLITLTLDLRLPLPFLF